jgi:hypothetical protein
LKLKFLPRSLKNQDFLNKGCGMSGIMLRKIIFIMIFLSLTVSFASAEDIINSLDRWLNENEIYPIEENKITWHTIGFGGKGTITSSAESPPNAKDQTDEKKNPMEYVYEIAIEHLSGLLSAMLFCLFLLIRRQSPSSKIHRNEKIL